MLTFHDSPSDRSQDDPFDRVVERLVNARPTAKGVRAQCPAHDDHTPSLDVDRGADGRVLIRCRSANCSTDAIVAALGLKTSDLFPPRVAVVPSRANKRAKKDLKRHATMDKAVRAAHWSATDGKHDGKVTTYIYCDEIGEGIGCVVRIDFDDARPKAIRRVSRDGEAWLCRDMLAPKPLYRLPALLNEAVDEPVLLVEGEKCVHTLDALGFVATTSSGGAHAPLGDTDWSPLAERPVVILPDNDDAGRRYCAAVVARVRAAGATGVQVLDLPELDVGGDVFDWAAAQDAAGRTRDEVIAHLRALIAKAPDAPEGSPEEPDPQDQQLGPPLVPLGERDPFTGRLVLSPRRTLPTAHAFLREFHTHAEGRTIHDYAGTLWAWRGNRSSEIEEGHLRQQLHPWLHEALRYIWNKQTRQPELTPFEGNPTTVTQAFATVHAVVHLPAAIPSPAWLGSGDPPFPLHEVMPCKSMTLHIPTGRTLLPTPSLFAFNALDFDYDAGAPEPVHWHAFLRELWGDDAESVNLLQEWFGYSLVADTSQQKMLLLVGPRRSGKGTIARVLTRLVGAGNVVGPTVSSLAGNFGLQPLLGRTLAIVSDARFAGDNISIVVERLLCISGEDAISVDRKFLGSVSTKLPIRFVFLTNELPRFSDASTALAGRFLVLRLINSFYGHENVNLTNELLGELPGILLWALHGWHRLRQRGRFLEPEASRAAITDIEDLSSPVSAFVRERCVVGPGHRIACLDLYTAWCSWCSADGRTSHTTAQVFGRDLAAAIPGVMRRRCTRRPPFYEGIGLTSGETP